MEHRPRKKYLKKNIIISLYVGKSLNLFRMIGLDINHNN